MPLHYNGVPLCARCVRLCAANVRAVQPNDHEEGIRSSIVPQGDFRKLRVWKSAHALMLDVHRVAIGIRGAHYLSLRSQIIRAAMSIPANIVEGRAQKSERDFARFLGYSIASTREVEYDLLAAHDIGVIADEDFESLMKQSTEVRKMLCGLIARLEAANPRTPPGKVGTP